ncbi:MAG TPA: hypothetical protein EYN67_02705 [Flavobacteriales bacterium]|nr:hypothetical protein [Flavobacteriales bacterium]
MGLVRAYGASTGVTLTVNDVLIFELAFEYMLVSASDEVCVASTSSAGCVMTETANIDKYTSMGVGINYHF